LATPSRRQSAGSVATRSAGPPPLAMRGTGRWRGRQRRAKRARSPATRRFEPVGDPFVGVGFGWLGAAATRAAAPRSRRDPWERRSCGRGGASLVISLIYYSYISYLSLLLPPLPHLFLAVDFHLFLYPLFNLKYGFGSEPRPRGYKKRWSAAVEIEGSRCAICPGCLVRWLNTLRQ
jgi:hypothetical protein